MPHSLKVAAFTKYDRRAASTRQRLLQYVPAFERAGIQVEYHPLLSNDYVRSLADGSRASRLAIAKAYGSRLRDLTLAGRADLIWIYAELFPWLPSPFERLALRSGRPVIYDWDDAFHVPYDEAPHPAIRRLLGGKLQPLLQGAAACTSGNAFLAEYACRFCPRTLVVPTVVDTDVYRPVERSEHARLTIGWIGSPTTWANVRPLLPMLSKLASRLDLRIKVVGAGRQAEADRFESLELVNWSEGTEVADVQAMDIGIMPLADRPFERGKSGYKLVQYMACGLPVVASPVGVNSEIVVQGESGFLATSAGEWEQRLTELARDSALRRRMGEVGRARAVERYSLASQAPRLIELFRSVVDQCGGRA